MPEPLSWSEPKQWVESKAPTTTYNVYVDLVCSRMQVGTVMFQEILQGGSRAWMSMLFGRSNVAYMVHLAALSHVYVYYPINFGFLRTIDNRTRYPIFEIELARIRQLKLVVPGIEDKTQASDEELMTSMFGPAQDAAGETVWRSSPSSAYYVYKLGPQVKSFFALTQTQRQGKAITLANDHDKRTAFFNDVIVFDVDEEHATFWYGVYVPRK